MKSKVGAIATLVTLLLSSKSAAELRYVPEEPPAAQQPLPVDVSQALTECAGKEPAAKVPLDVDGEPVEATCRLVTALGQILEAQEGVEDKLRQLQEMPDLGAFLMDVKSQQQHKQKLLRWWQRAREHQMI